MVRIILRFMVRFTVTVMVHGTNSLPHTTTGEDISSWPNMVCRLDDSQGTTIQ